MNMPTEYPPPSTGPYGTPAEATRHTHGTGFAITAMVTGIVGAVFSWVPIFDVVLGVVAIVFGAIALQWARHGQAPGKGMAIAGLVLGIITVAVFVVWVIIIASQPGG